jgi:hypothetical protein
METAMLNYYPLFIALAGVVIAALLSQRAISQMQADAKAALVDATARTRLLNAVAGVAFVGLVVWRPIVGWVFLGVAYVCLSGRSIIRIQHMNIPAPAARLLQAAHLTVALGMLACASIYAQRSLQ